MPCSPAGGPAALLGVCCTPRNRATGGSQAALPQAPRSAAEPGFLQDPALGGAARLPRAPSVSTSSLSSLWLPSRLGVQEAFTLQMDTQVSPGWSLSPITDWEGLCPGRGGGEDSPAVTLVGARQREWAPGPRRAPTACCVLLWVSLRCRLSVWGHRPLYGVQWRPGATSRGRGLCSPWPVPSAARRLSASARPEPLVPFQGPAAARPCAGAAPAPSRPWWPCCPGRAVRPCGRAPTHAPRRGSPTSARRRPRCWCRG